LKVRLAVSIPPVVPVRFSGPRDTKEIDALLDTGATYCILSWDDALDLGYEVAKASHIPVATAGGLIHVPRITVAAIEVLGFRRVRVPTLVKDLSESGLEAIIGWSFLDRFRLTIDARRKRLELSDR